MVQAYVKCIFDGTMFKAKVGVIDLMQMMGVKLLVKGGASAGSTGQKGNYNNGLHVVGLLM